MNFILRAARITTEDLDKAGRLLAGMSKTPGVVLNMDDRTLSFTPDITQEATDKAAFIFAEICRIPGMVIEKDDGTGTNTFNLL